MFLLSVTPPTHYSCHGGFGTSDLEAEDALAALCQSVGLLLPRNQSVELELASFPKPSLLSLEVFKCPPKRPCGLD